MDLGKTFTDLHASQNILFAQFFPSIDLSVLELEFINPRGWRNFSDFVCLFISTYAREMYAHRPVTITKTITYRQLLNLSRRPFCPRVSPDLSSSSSSVFDKYCPSLSLSLSWKKSRRKTILEDRLIVRKERRVENCSRRFVSLRISHWDVRLLDLVWTLKKKKSKKNVTPTLGIYQLAPWGQPGWFGGAEEGGGKDARRAVHGERMQFLVHSKSRASAWTVILLSHEYVYVYVQVFDGRKVEIVEARGWKEWKRCCFSLEKCDNRCLQRD